MAKTSELRSAKAAAKGGDRHNMTRPDQQPAEWARQLTTLRVADLFKTLNGLPGHWAQVQAEVNAGNHHFYAVNQFGGGYNDGGKTSAEGKDIIKFISSAIVSAAKAADFDFGVQQLSFTRDMAWLKISRTAGNVTVHSTP